VGGWVLAGSVGDLSVAGSVGAAVNLREKNQKIRS
jgi:hypothetical protein